MLDRHGLPLLGEEAERAMRRALLEPELDAAVEGFAELMRAERWMDGEAARG